MVEFLQRWKWRATRHIHLGARVYQELEPPQSYGAFAVSGLLLQLRASTQHEDTALASDIRKRWFVFWLAVRRGDGTAASKLLPHKAGCRACSAEEANERGE